MLIIKKGQLIVSYMFTNVKAYFLKTITTFYEMQLARIIGLDSVKLFRTYLFSQSKLLKILV